MTTNLMATAVASLLLLGSAWPQSPDSGQDNDPRPQFTPRPGHGVYQKGDEFHAIGIDHKATFRRGGMTFTPALGELANEDAPVRLELQSIRRGDTVLLNADGSAMPQQYGNTIFYDHGNGIRECYAANRENVHQTFVFERRPAGTGDLVVRMRMATRLPVRAREHGGLSCAVDGIGGVTFDAVTGISACGAQASGEMRRDGEYLELVLPAAFVDGAAMPLVLDPIISAKLDITTGNTKAPAVAFVSGYYLVVWVHQYSALSADIFAQRVFYDGTLGPVTTVYNAPSWARTPKVAALEETSSRFFVVWEENGGTTWTQIRGCTVDMISLWTSSPVTIASSGGWLHNPDVGGDRTNSSRYLMVVWDSSNNGIKGRRVFVPPYSPPMFMGTPTVFAAFPEFTIDANSGGAINTQPAISKTAGDTGEYLVVWRSENAGNSTIYGRMVDEIGNLLGSSRRQFSQSLTTQTDQRNPDCDGDGTNFIVTWQRAESQGASKYDVYARHVFHNAGTFGTKTIRPVAATPNHDEIDPAVAFAGYQAMIAYGNEATFGHEILVTSVDPFTAKVGHAPVKLNSVSSTFGNIDIVSHWNADWNGVTGTNAHYGMVTWQLSSVVRARIYESPSDATVLGGKSGSGGDTYAPCAFDGNANFTIHLRGGAASLPVLLAVSHSSLPLPWGTGTLWPTVGTVLMATTTDGSGKASINISIPTGLTGTPLVAQWLTPDGLGFLGFSTSDAIQLTVLDP